MKKVLRVAFFPDSYLEINGVAMTSKKLTGYAQKMGYPFLCIHAGDKTEVTTTENFINLSLKRSPLSFNLDEGLKYDPFFNRHLKKVRREIEKFKPDVFHITGLNDVSIIGAILSHQLQIPMVGAWHTNLHQFAGRRLEKMFWFLPQKSRASLSNFAERKILNGAILYYKMPKVLLVPNEELIEILKKGTGRDVRLMIRGVEPDFYSPTKRTVTDGIFRFGFVGRLRAEKNIRLLAKLEEKLLEAGCKNFKFLIVGDGNEREWLEKNMKQAEFTGFVEGEDLARAYANMDVFVFPSETDTFGNVIQEANASGVPSIVTDKGGPKFIVRNGETGFIAKSFDDFVKYSLELVDNSEKLSKMKQASREFALSRSWDAIFESVYEAYEEAYAKRSPAKT